MIQAHEDEAVNRIHNAHKLKTQYNYTVEYLTELAIDCQKKYGLYTTAKSVALLVSRLEDTQKKTIDLASFRISIAHLHHQT